MSGSIGDCFAPNRPDRDPTSAGAGIGSFRARWVTAKRQYCGVGKNDYLPRNDRPSPRYQAIAHDGIGAPVVRG